MYLYKNQNLKIFLNKDVKKIGKIISIFFHTKLLVIVLFLEIKLHIDNEKFYFHNNFYIFFFSQFLSEGVI